MRERAAERDEIGDFPINAYGALLSPDSRLQGSAVANVRRALQKVVIGLQRRSKIGFRRVVSLLPQVGQRVVADDAAEAVSHDDDPVIPMPGRVVIQSSQEVECGRPDGMTHADVWRRRAQVPGRISDILEPEVRELEITKVPY